MPSINTRNLTLTTVGTKVTINVTYKAVFSPFERVLAANGLQFFERIRVLGVDGANGEITTVLPIAPTFVAQLLPVTAGIGSETISRDRSITVSRSFLQEDPNLGDPDEIQCRIEIEPIGLPASLSTLTDVEVLLG